MSEKKFNDLLKVQPSKDELEQDQKEIDDVLNKYSSKWIGCPKPSAIAWSVEALETKRKVVFDGGEQIYETSSGNKYVIAVFVNGMHIPDFLSVSFMTAGDLSVDDQLVETGGIGCSLKMQQSSNNLKQGQSSSPRQNR